MLAVVPPPRIPYCKFHKSMCTDTMLSERKCKSKLGKHRPCNNLTFTCVEALAIGGDRQETGTLGRNKVETQRYGALTRGGDKGKRYYSRF